jgi:hypothetical protein
MHFMFVKSVVIILSQAFGVEVKESSEQIRKMAADAPFVVAPLAKKVIKTGDNDPVQEKGDSDEEKLNHLVIFIF